MVSKEEWGKVGGLWLKDIQQRSVTDGVERLDALEALCERYRAELMVRRLELLHTYPRLDVEVTRGMNHLLKAPFCVHPKTQKLCLPIDPEHIIMNVFEGIDELLLTEQTDGEVRAFDLDTVSRIEGVLAGDEQDSLGQLERGVRFFQEQFLRPLLQEEHPGFTPAWE
eukprot:gnl/Dysnectes_brevis/3225_a4032_593.p2 GENE.gnl/Dysnectes_brevis/3225_a4032_593~~gnl/Dysnectes_brevis/3225_a4032_593.p2  ORF type:complete len:168 (-),score=86.84 gnl/Dysnectes_brevis/3225_a4032_593:619-1122(-)